jgi:hypothetical protein
MYYDNLKTQCSVCHKKEYCTQCLFNLENITNKPKCSEFTSVEKFSNTFEYVMSLLEKYPILFQRLIYEATFE